MDKLRIVVLELGPLQTNCYILTDEKSLKAVVIDPADEGERIWNFLEEKKWTLEKILLTHGHYDHIGGVPLLKKLSGVEVWIHEADAGMLTDSHKNLSFFLGLSHTEPDADKFLKEGLKIEIGSSKIRVLHTPGHTSGSVSFVGDDFAIVGDTLFQNSVGRTDFPGSSYEVLLDSIQRKLLVLGDEIRIYPGHGPSTTVGRERKRNPFIVGNES